MRIEISDAKNGYVIVLFKTGEVLGPRTIEKRVAPSIKEAAKHATELMQKAIDLEYAECNATSANQK